MVEANRKASILPDRIAIGPVCCNIFSHVRIKVNGRSRLSAMR
jgi:hypothetical protein